MMNDFLTFLLAALLGILIGFVAGLAVTKHSTSEEVLRQCKAGEFYFFDGVGIHCPTVQDNRKEQK